LAADEEMTLAESSPLLLSTRANAQTRAAVFHCHDRDARQKSNLLVRAGAENLIIFRRPSVNFGIEYGNAFSFAVYAYGYDRPLESAGKPRVPHGSQQFILLRRPPSFHFYRRFAHHHLFFLNTELPVAAPSRQLGHFFSEIARIKS
jgi:hypothetical protein